VSRDFTALTHYFAEQLLTGSSSRRKESLAALLQQDELSTGALLEQIQPLIEQMPQQREKLQILEMAERASAEVLLQTPS